MNLETIFFKFYSEIVNYSMRFLKDKEAAKEVAQESFIRLHSSKLDLANTKVARSYLYTTARNLSLNEIRNRGRRDDLLLTFLDKNEVENDIEQKTIEELYKAVNDLPDRMKSIILLLLREYTYEDIARELDISVNTVKTMRRKALDKLRNYFTEAEWIFIMTFFKK